MEPTFVAPFLPDLHPTVGAYLALGMVLVMFYLVNLLRKELKP